MIFSITSNGVKNHHSESPFNKNTPDLLSDQNH